MKKSTVIILLIFASLVALYFLWPSDENRIRKLFGEGAKALESRNLDGVMEKISFNYRDDYGLTYLSLKGILKEEFGRFSDVKVEYSGLRVQIFKGANSKTASVWMDVRVIATGRNETGYIVGDVRDPAHLRFTLMKERTKWLIVKAEGWERQ